MHTMNTKLHTPASSGLTAGQRSLLASVLETRRHALQRQLDEHHEGLSRVEHAAAVLRQDADDAEQRASDRDVDMALSDLILRQRDAIDQALQRLHSPEFGLCVSCGEAIPFDRLRIEPEARRCVPCETQREGKR